MNQGKFIVIEGLDGSGTTTQVELLVDYLRSKKIRAYPTKEPTDNFIGGTIRGAISGSYALPDTSLQLLFSADRGHHLQRVINPLLKSGAVVVCDRYYWSTIAFGSVTLDRDWLLTLQKYFTAPDLSIFLKVDAKVCVKRLLGDRFKVELFEKEEKMRVVWKTYEWLAQKNPSLIKIIDGEGEIEDIFERIKPYVDKLLGLKED